MCFARSPSISTFQYLPHCMNKIQWWNYPGFEGLTHRWKRLADYGLSPWPPLGDFPQFFTEHWGEAMMFNLPPPIFMHTVFFCFSRNSDDICNMFTSRTCVWWLFLSVMCWLFAVSKINAKRLHVFCRGRCWFMTGVCFALCGLICCHDNYQDRVRYLFKNESYFISFRSMKS